MSSNDIYHLIISDVKGNDTILLDDEAGILCKTWNIKATMPMQLDIANTERTAGRVVFTDMIFTKMADLATPALYSSCASGKVHTATLRVGRTASGEYLPMFTFVMSNAMISTIKTEATGDGNFPTDFFQLNFSQITIEYKQQGIDVLSPGNDSFGWNLSLNMPA
ncbi:MAG: hypothetical protein CBC42_04115 [Betaproteobacteria bacterium TMED82]|nr:MAG: hypothetical protein CBC42_04115 [Betaproteobacteria bacterium TMED82]|tara:strand:- start:21116 stop:21610 length:495 start_codon:yes stop_codon:yes gene_type:complete